jgi:hypothetical protein
LADSESKPFIGPLGEINLARRRFARASSLALNSKSP